MRRARRRERRRHGHVPLVGLRRGVRARDAVAREIERQRTPSRRPAAIASPTGPDAACARSACCCRRAGGSHCRPPRRTRGRGPPRASSCRRDQPSLRSSGHQQLRASHLLCTPASQGALFFIAMLLVTASLGRVRFPPPAPPPRVFGNFVELRGGALFLDGKPLPLRRHQHLLADDARRTAQLRAGRAGAGRVRRTGLRVVRTWAFWLGPQNSLHPEGSDNHCSAAGCPIGDRAADGPRSCGRRGGSARHPTDPHAHEFLGRVWRPAQAAARVRTRRDVGWVGADRRFVPRRLLSAERSARINVPGACRGAPSAEEHAEVEDGVSSARYHGEDDSSSAVLFDRTTAALGQLTGAPQWAAALVLVGATFCGSTMVLATLASRCLRCVAGARHRWLHIVDEPPSAAEL